MSALSVLHTCNYFALVLLLLYYSKLPLNASQWIFVLRTGFRIITCTHKVIQWCCAGCYGVLQWYQLVEDANI